MKKRICCLLAVLLTFFVLTGCVAEEPTGRPVEIPPEMQLCGMHDGKIILSEFRQNVDNTGKSVIAYYSFALDGGEPTLIGELKNWESSGGNVLIMSDGRLYDASLAGDPPGQQLWAFPLDGSTSELIEDDKNDLFPFRNITRLNEDEFIVNGTQILDEETGRTRSYVKKYNVKSGEYVTLLEEEYEKEISQGKQLVKVCCYEGKIYVYVNVIDGKIEQKLEVYDSNGEFVEEFPLKTVHHELNHTLPDVIWTMGAYGDYFVFGTLNGNTFVYKLEDGAFVKLDSYEWMGPYHHSLGMETAPIKRVLFWGTAFPTELKSFTFEDEKTTSINVEIDPERSNIEAFAVSEKGELVLVMSDTTYYASDSGASRMLYYFTADEVDALFS